MLLIEGVNMVKRHLKAGARGTRQGGIIDMEKPLDASKVMLVCLLRQAHPRELPAIGRWNQGPRCKQCHQMIS